MLSAVTSLKTSAWLICFSARMRAIAPATAGAAIDVPSRASTVAINMADDRAESKEKEN